ncbi:MAG: LysR substrate-binding domain-containing protein [Polyangiaceae bacterium]
MNQAHLRAFHEVAKVGSFTAAARRLHVSQPAVTMAVKALEQTYGVELFLRRGRGVLRTELGDELYNVTTTLFGTEEAAEELLAGARGLRQGRLRVGADAPYHVMGVLAAFHERHPGVGISLSVGNAPEVVRGLFEGSTDVAVSAEVAADARLYTMPCARYGIVAIVGRSHPWARRRRIAIEELDGAKMVLREPESVTRRTLDAALVKVGVKPKIVMEIGSREAVREAVAAGLGVGVVASPELGEDARLRALEIDGATLLNTEYAVCLAARRDVRVVRAFFDVVSRTLKAGLSKTGLQGEAVSNGIKGEASP